MCTQAFVSPLPAPRFTRSTTFNSSYNLRRTAFLYSKSVRTTPHHISHKTNVPCESPHTPPSMALSNVVISGGSGFVGTRITQLLQAAGTNVKVLTRSKASSLPTGAEPIRWTPSNPSDTEWYSALANADLVVNLAGHPVVCRWDDKSRNAIISSRVDSTSSIVRAIKSLPPEQRPKCLASASAIGFYGTSETADFDEASTPGQGFLVDVCKKWEAEADNLTVPETRVVKIRIGVVMGVGGGALGRMLPAFQFFVGGPVGTGEQWVPWVHIDDLAKIFIKAGEDPTMNGVYNGTAPNPVTMNQLAESLGSALGRPSLFPVPGFVLKGLYGDGASVVLEGARVLPNRLLGQGFDFSYPRIDDCMKAVAETA